MMMRMVNNVANNFLVAVLRRGFLSTERFIRYDTLYFWTHYIAIDTCKTSETSGKHLREPSLGLVLFWLADLSVSLLPDVFENLVNAIDVAHRGLPADPINDDRPLEHIEITFRLREDLVGSGR